MAARDTAEGHPAAASRAKALNRRQSVLGAGRVKAAHGREQGGEQEAVAANQEQEQAFHLLFRSKFEGLKVGRFEGWQA